MLSRREFTACAALGAFAPAKKKFRVGAMDGVVGRPTQSINVELARAAGLDGLQITLGRQDASDHLELHDSAMQSQFIQASRQHSVALVSTYLDILHENCLMNDVQAVKWGLEAIAINRAMNIDVLMLVFFGKCALKSREQMDAVVAPLKKLCLAAEANGITLGFENTIAADDDLRILEQVNSKALKVFYDIGNATNLYKVDPAKEIRQLGRERLCQFHFKDKGWLGEGAVKVPAALAALQAIGYDGYIVLETDIMTHDAVADASRNAAWLRAQM